MYRSVTTVNADAARRAFGATGGGIVWAVVDTGIDPAHPHFRQHRNLDLPAPLVHCDFTGATPTTGPPADEHGHGTHVAGLIAGELAAGDGLFACARILDAEGKEAKEVIEIPSVAGMAPQCKLVSMRVLDRQASSQTSTVIAALQAIQVYNDHGRHLRIHVVHLGLGYEFDAKWYACGRSPICVEVDRLVRSGVVVVTSAGNAGYGYHDTVASGTVAQGLESSIQDPGNAELGITVGSTHRDLPREFGVSYFSAKGPTLDGRLKPDIVAPGERTISCAAAARLAADQGAGQRPYQYAEDSGTSIAAAHVSGVVAALLSARPDLAGRPDRVKQTLLASATDLGRMPSYQGRGLVNLLRAVQTDPMEASVRGGTTRVAEAGSGTPPVSAAPEGGGPLRLVCGYALGDAILWDELETHLNVARRQGLFELWSPKEVLPGDDADAEMTSHLDQADIILFLVSADLFKPESEFDKHVEHALRRHHAKAAKVIPVLVRQVDWSGLPLAKLKPLPRNGQPVRSWSRADDAWSDVATGIRQVAQRLAKTS